MEKCFNCRKEAVAQICATCGVGVCMWCFSFHFDHQLKYTKDYLTELLNGRQTDLAKHFDFITKANDIKAVLESSLQQLKEPEEIERAQRRLTELVEYISEVTAASEYLEQLANTLETTKIDEPMAFIEKIKSAKTDICVPKFLGENDPAVAPKLSERQEALINRNKEDAKQPFSSGIESKVDELIENLNKETKQALVELEGSINSKENTDIVGVAERIELLYVRLKEDFLRIVSQEECNPQQMQDVQETGTEQILNSKLSEENKKLKEEIASNQKKIADHKRRLKESIQELSLIHICRCRRIERCRSRWSPYH
eukprot:TRINITY_DN13501_c0_g3_i5.p1 TRINITY_DN13501_c0_g3~~TRINITY_DN13501_c0_g3_i5.p1  ORF type:complete len:314 (-),score=72.45 TRINITY_DN13501_c0_g3_i5:24-965(-)